MRDLVRPFKIFVIHTQVFDCVKPRLIPTEPSAPRTTKNNLSRAKANDLDELALFLERDKVHSIKGIQEKLNFNNFVITSYMCGEILII